MIDRLQFTANLTICKSNRQTKGGIEYLVAPVVMLVEGVVNDELALAENFGDIPGVWNGIPLVIGHPTAGDGSPLSANFPDTLAEIETGRVFNVEIDGKKLKGEAWVNLVQARQSTNGRELVARLDSNQPVEVSTAYFCDHQATPGYYEGKKYSGIQKNFRPDHLAVLLRGTGACSWQDGCGAPRINQQEATMPYPNEHAGRINDPGKYERIRRENDKFGEGIHAIWGITKNGGEEKTELQSLRFDKKKFSPDEAKKWLKEHDYPTGSFEPAQNEDSGLAVQARAVFAALGDLLGIKINQEASAMKRDELIKAILDDGRLGLTEVQLNEMKDDALTALSDNLAKLKPNDDVDESKKDDTDKKDDEKDKGEDEVEPEKKDDVAPAESALPETLQQLSKIIEATGGVQAFEQRLTAMKTNEDAQRAQLVSQITANKASAFTAEELTAMPITVLGKLAQTFALTDYRAAGGEVEVDKDKIQVLERKDPLAPEQKKEA